ncbi:MAG: hypothetical protein KAG19_05540 [Methylococcales bacterium]|nr:hypothetical protein [Methylococcales bacterium]
MNKYVNDFKQFKSVAISGGQQSGKLTFALYFASKVTQKPISLISPFDQEAFNKKKIEGLRLESNLHHMLKTINAFSFKAEWKALKNSYGYQFLLNDIERIILEANDIIVFYRIDAFFEAQDINEIEGFLFNIMTAVQAAKKTVIFTLDTERSHSQFIQDYFKKAIDSAFSVSQRDYGSTARDITVHSLLFALPCTQFSFELNEKAKKFELASADGLEKSDLYKKESPYIVLATQSSELSRIVRYFFGNGQYSVNQIEPSLLEVGQAISVSLSPRFIIFNPIENQSSTELKKIGELIKGNHVKAVFISSRPVLRRGDKSEILQSGFCDVLIRDFYIEDFVISIERAMGLHFYTEEMKKVPDKTYVVYNEKVFQRFIKVFLCQHLFFTVFKFQYASSISELDVRKNLGRSFDMAFIDKEKKFVYLFLVNTLGRNLAVIERKFAKISQDIKMIGYKDSMKYIQGHNGKEV